MMFDLLNSFLGLMKLDASTHRVIHFKNTFSTNSGKANQVKLTNYVDAVNCIAIS